MKAGCKDMESIGPGVRIEVLGVRGSLPAADRSFMEYGGNTSCICLRYGGGVLCFDAGSGLTGLLDRLSGAPRLDILISHVHMDHILGLYALGSLRGTEVHLYGEAREGVPFRRQLEAVLGPPYWPLALCSAPSVHIHEIAAGDGFPLPGGAQVRTLRGNHPNGSVLYRVQLGERGVTYALDCELDEALTPALVEFAKDSGLLIWDASFTSGDKRPGWGHSTWEEGLAVAGRAGAERVLMTHYSGGYTDEFLARQERLAQGRSGGCIFAREGMVIGL